jgi:hypothetical protein
MDSKNNFTTNRVATRLKTKSILWKKNSRHVITEVQDFYSCYLSY